MKTKKLGPYLRELRHQRGLSLEEVADQAGIRKGYLSGIERSQVNPPSPKVIRELSKILRVPRKPLLFMSLIEKAPEEIRADLAGALGSMLRDLL